MSNQSLKVNASLNMIRRALAILFPVITFSYASHVLGAKGIGAYSFADSIVSYMVLLSSLGISIYAIREGQACRDDRRELEKFISEVYTINCIMTLVSYIVLMLLLLFWNKLNNYYFLIIILSFSILFNTIGTDWINTLLEDYLYITIRYIIIQIVCLIALFVFVHKANDLYYYAIIAMLSSYGGNLFNLIYIRKSIRIRLTSPLNCFKHLKPMLTLFSNNLAIRIYLIADVTILGILMADQFVGYYSVASKVYTALKEIINAVILVTVPRFSYYISHNMKESYYSSYHKVVDAVITLLFPIVVGTVFQANNILYYLGGQDYTFASNSLIILSFSLVFSVGSCLFSYSVIIPNKQDSFFLFSTILAAVLNILLNFILIPTIGMNAAAVTTLLSEALVCIMAMIKGKQYIDKLFIVSGDIKSSLFGSLIVALFCALINYTVKSTLFNMLLSVIGSILIYIFILVLMNNSLITDLINKIVAWSKAK